MSMKVKSFHRSSLLNLFSLFINFLLATACVIIIARSIGPEGKGIVTIVALIPPLLITFCGLGIEISNVYYLSKSIHTLRQAIGNSLLVTLVSTVLVTFLAIVFGKPLHSSLLKNIHMTFAALALASFPFQLMLKMILTIYQATEDFLRFNLVQVAISFLRLLIVLGFFLTGKLNIMWAVIAVTVPPIVICIPTAWHLIKNAGGLVINLRIFKQALTYGIKGYIGNTLQFFNYRLDAFVLNFFKGSGAVGIYSIAFTFAELLWFLPTAASLVLFPRATKLEQHESDRFTSQIVRISLFATLVCAILFTVIGYPLISLLFGDRFLYSYLPMLVLLPGVFALSLSKLLSSNIYARGFPIVNSLFTAIALVVTITLDFLLIPRYGVIGAALATTIAYTTSALLFISFYKTKASEQLPNILFIKRSDFHALKGLFTPKKYG